MPTVCVDTNIWIYAINALDLRIVYAFSYWHRYLLNTSSRQGLPGSRSHGWQQPIVTKAFLPWDGIVQLSEFIHENLLFKLFFYLYISHPCDLDFGNPCRNDGNTICIDTYAYWDCLILSEDMQHQQQIDGLRIINPFK